MSTTLNVHDDSGWTEAWGYQTGTKKKVLHDENGVMTFLLSCPAGLMIPSQSHPFVEEHIVLKGRLLHEGKVIPAGTFQHFEPDEVHGPFECPEKVMALVIYYPR